ncbi:hypothetical protein [Nostoc edaphicum]|uniref:hypothetical protein n=1 Tax=Nostoc edaphicum TaxID=264686 RepID=UPI001D15E229|nr:hypothetical protein [Nostoc edaphicum]
MVTEQKTLNENYTLKDLGVTIDRLGVEIDTLQKEKDKSGRVNFFTDNQGNESSIRLMSFFALITAIIFGSLSLINAHKPSNTNSNSSSSDVNMTFIFLVAAFVPKALQKFAEIKGETEQTKENKI